jgi:hypothetical protein
MPRHMGPDYSALRGASQHPSDQELSEGPHDRESQVPMNSAMMGCLGHRDPADAQNLNSSTASSFMNQIKRLVEPETSISPQSPVSPAFLAARRSQSRKVLRRQQAVDYVLPSRQRADHLLSVYRRLVLPLYPFLELDEFDQLYQRLWTGDDLGDNALTFVCLVNVVFSLACNLDTTAPLQQRISNAQVFYERAIEVLQSTTVHEPSLLLVQCYLLLGQYLQSSDDPEQCWIFIGFGVRIAQSLGLDIPSTSALQPEAQRESMRRLWHGCVLMDQVLSMTFGKPAMTLSRSASSVPLPQAHPDGALCQCSDNTGTDPTGYHFFVETLKLYALMTQALQMLYVEDAEAALNEDPSFLYFGTSGAKAVSSLLELNDSLSAWCRHLPYHLRREPFANKPATLQRHSNVLFFRYNHVRILLFRPILARYCSHDPSKGDEFTDSCLSGAIAKQVSMACVKAALKIIATFDAVTQGREVEDFDELLPAWWYSIFYLYTAATVLLAAKLSHDLLAEITEETLHESWGQAMRTLERYKIFGEQARRCATALDLLSDQVSRQMHQGDKGRGEARLAPEQDAGLETIGHPNDSLGALANLEATPSIIDGVVHTTNWVPPGMGRQKASSAEDVVRHFNVSGVQLGIFGDMSWLSSMPSQRY